jgi:hypothetical protein
MNKQQYLEMLETDATNSVTESLQFLRMSIIEYSDYRVEGCRHLENLCILLNRRNKHLKTLTKIIQGEIDGTWKLVPVVATDEMLQAYGETIKAPAYLYKYGQKPHEAAIKAAPSLLDEMILKEIEDNEKRM